MEPFVYTDGPDAIRPDLVAAYRGAWEHIAKPGTWLTGAERVAVAAETRAAVDCALCRERKQALSPFSVDGEHDHASDAPDNLVDLAHRLTTDAPRMSDRYFQSLVEKGLSPEAYVETVGVAVITISIDRFHRALGLPLETLPQPQAGAPSKVRPNDVVLGEAWVPMREAKPVAKELGMPVAPYVIRALSLVPAEVLAWQDVSGAQYLGPDQMTKFGKLRAIDRSQIELVAGRVSALNECFY